MRENMKVFACCLALICALSTGCSSREAAPAVSAPAEPPAVTEMASVPQVILPEDPDPLPTPEPVEEGYILNLSSKKFHRPSCSSVDQMKESNKGWSTDREALLEEGYSPCKRCQP